MAYAADPFVAALAAGLCVGRMAARAAPAGLGEEAGGMTTQTIGARAADRGLAAPVEIADDLFGDIVLADRDAHFADWREQAAVVYLPTNQLWAITRFGPLKAALGDPSTFSSAKPTFNNFMNASLQGTALASDPRNIRRCARCLQAIFRPACCACVRTASPSTPRNWSARP